MEPIQQGTPGNTSGVEIQQYPVQFHGSAGEYFKIWIVNLALTILTLGIYSAWAKVRSSRYFLGNTELAGYRFGYVADPFYILKGRLLLVGLFVLQYFLRLVIPHSEYEYLDFPALC
jgi:uncharacterized membrane protein YjgN (DUF898 family)